METIESFPGGWARAEGASDAARLDELLSDDFSCIGPLGFVPPTSAWLARYQGGVLTCQSFSLDEIQTRTRGGTAIVTPPRRRRPRRQSVREDVRDPPISTPDGSTGSTRSQDDA